MHFSILYTECNSYQRLLQRYGPCSKNFLSVKSIWSLSLICPIVWRYALDKTEIHKGNNFAIYGGRGYGSCILYSYTLISTNLQVLSLKRFSDGIKLYKIKENNSDNRKGRVMLLALCTPSHCYLSNLKFNVNMQNCFKDMPWTKWWTKNRRTKRWSYALPLGCIINK